MSSIQLSVSLQTYNRGSSGYLRAALEAILAQTYGDFELLVIDNHSTDETPEIVLSCKDSRLTYMRLPPGGTPADSIRRAFGASRGRYLLTTHDDDIMEPTMIARQMHVMEEHPELGCLATNVSLIDERGDILQEKLYKMESDRFFGIGDYIQIYFEEKLWFPTPTLLFNRDISSSRNSSFVREANPSYAPSGDIAGMFNMNLHAPVAILAEPLLRYRQHADQESRNVDQSAPLLTLAKYAESLLANQEGNARLRALSPTIHAFSARYQAQDHLFKLEGTQLESALMELNIQWEKSTVPEDRAIDTILPFEILLGELGNAPTIPRPELIRLLQQPSRTIAQLAYRQWAELVHNGRSLFSNIREFRSIVILGSMLTAHLLVLSASRCGIKVHCCLDSSTARIGHRVFGVPVVAHEELAKFMREADAVILSSEREHDDGLKAMLQERMGMRDLPVHSWKHIAKTASNRWMEQDSDTLQSNIHPTCESREAS